MRTFAVAALAAFFLALFGVASMPAQDGVTIFAYWYQRADTTILALTLAVIVMPVILLAAVFTQEKDRNQWSFQRLTMKRDIDQLMTVLRDLGTAQKGLGQGAYVIGETDPAAEARKLAASIGEAEARLADFERHLGDKAALDTALKTATERQAKLQERFAGLQARLGPVMGELTRMDECQASLSAKLGELEQAGGLSKLQQVIADGEQFADRAEIQVGALADLRDRVGRLMPKARSLSERMTEMNDRKSGIARRVEDLDEILGDTRSAYENLPSLTTINERLQAAASEEPVVAGRVAELEKLLPRISATRQTFSAVRSKISPLTDESTGVWAALDRVEQTLEQIRTELKNAEIDDDGNSVHDAVETLQAAREEVERRIAQVEARALKLVGLAGEFGDLKRKLNGAGHEATS